MSLYIDASFMVPTLITEATSAAVDTFMLTDGRERFVSDFAAAEIAAVLARLVRMNLLVAASASAKLADFETWRAAATSPADLHASDARLAYSYVSRFDLKLRAPDALHLAIARRLDATLVTFDHRLADAAAALGIDVAMPTSG